MLTSLSHAKTFLVSSSALPMSLSISIAPAPQLREPSSGKQPGAVVGLLLYAVGIGIVRDVPTVTGNRRSGSVIAMYYRTSKQPITDIGLNKVGNLLGDIHVVGVARQKRACAEINANISPFQLSPYICKTYTDIVLECTTLWGEPDRVHMQNMEQLSAYESMSSECD